MPFDVAFSIYAISPLKIDPPFHIMSECMFADLISGILPVYIKNNFYENTTRIFFFSCHYQVNTRQCAY